MKHLTLANDHGITGHMKQSFISQLPFQGNTEAENSKSFKMFNDKTIQFPDNFWPIYDQDKIW